MCLEKYPYISVPNVNSRIGTIHHPTDNNIQKDERSLFLSFLLGVNWYKHNYSIGNKMCVSKEWENGILLNSSGQREANATDFVI